MSVINDIARDITMRVMFKEYSPPDYPEFVSIASPKIRSVCYYWDDTRGMIKVRIRSGKLWGTYGLSNVWTWKELDTGEEKGGYGCFFRRTKKK